MDMDRYEELIKMVNECRFREAAELFTGIQDEEFNDTLAVLGSVIYHAFGDEELEYDYIRRGLIYNYKNYELYLLLGNYYERRNINQAWLCYENALFYCDSGCEDDRRVILEYKKHAEEDIAWKVRKTSIVILSYNLPDIMVACIESIRANNPATAYELVVVDNNSSDRRIVKWLGKQPDIRLICNDENKGFPAGCNQGIGIADPEADIFLLNNDTVVPPNALFWLRMGLYESEKVGAVGSVSNYVSNYQMVDEKYDTVDEYIQFAIKNNVPSRNPYEKKIYLVGFALLIKRAALDETGLIDERFTPGNFEDNDIGLRLQYAGWQVVLCHNSFIYHYGSGNGANLKSWSPALSANAVKLKQKYGFDMQYYVNVRNDVISLINHNHCEPIRVLEVGCGLGMTLSRIKYLWPESVVCGIELSKDIAHIAANQSDVICGNIEDMPKLPYEKEYFDYIILADVIEHLAVPEKVLGKLKKYLKPDGEILLSIPNVQHWSVVLPLINGEFEYQDSGILDRTYLKFFTYKSITEMLENMGMRPRRTHIIKAGFIASKKMLKMKECIEQVLGRENTQMLDAYQYVLAAGKVENVEHVIRNSMMSGDIKNAKEQLKGIGTGKISKELVALKMLMRVYEAETENNVSYTIFDYSLDLDVLYRHFVKLKLLVRRLEFDFPYELMDELYVYCKTNHVSYYFIGVILLNNMFNREKVLGRLIEMWSRKGCGVTEGAKYFELFGRYLKERSDG